MQDKHSEWFPLVGISVFKFGEPLSHYFAKYSLVENEELYIEKGGWRTYNVPDSQILISVEKDQLVSISCYTSLNYKNRNLIGLPIAAVIKIVGVLPKYGDPVWLDEEEQQITAEFDNVGLMLWLDGNKVVVSADVTGPT